MDPALFIQTSAYLIAAMAAVSIAVGLYVRSSRSAVFYTLLSCILSILLTLMLRLVELYAPNETILSLMIAAGLLSLSLTVFLYIQLVYTAVTRSRFPLLLQMFSGAGALIVFFIRRQFFRDDQVGFLSINRAICCFGSIWFCLLFSSWVICLGCFMRSRATW